MKITGVLLCFLGAIVSGLAADPDVARGLNERALAAHRQRSLNEASRLYTQLLTLDPPAGPTAPQRDLVLKFAPRLQTVAGEFFPLKDVVAIIHPDRPVISYRLLWEAPDGRAHPIRWRGAGPRNTPEPTRIT